MCSRKRLTFIKDFNNNESVCHFMVVQLFKLSTKDISLFVLNVSFAVFITTGVPTGHTMTDLVYVFL